MPYSEKSNISLQNSKQIDFCPRCTKRVSRSRRRFAQGVLKYYKKLCKNSTCVIHKRNAFQSKKIICENAVRKMKHDHNRIKRLSASKNQCWVHEFEDDEQSNQINIDPQSYARIQSTVINIDSSKDSDVEDVVGLGLLKQIINRTIIWPLKKPEVFKGLRNVPKGVLLFGPPGTGKTLIGKWIAFETQSTFFNISSSSLTSKWIGESENLVRTMFVVAKARQPSVIFIDEVDSLLSHRKPFETGTSRRMKNEFFVQMDGTTTLAEDRVMVVGATNKPGELDPAARRRFVKRLYISLPDSFDRKELLLKFLQYECHSLEEPDVNLIVKKTEGYSAADLRNLSQEAAMVSVRSFSPDAIFNLQPNKIRPISLDDFLSALKLIKPSVSAEELRSYEEWDSLYGYRNESLKN